MMTSSLLERFLGYTRFETSSNPRCADAPSSPGQLVFARHLVDELQVLGALSVELSEFGVVTAHIPAHPDCTAAPALGLIAHMDTSSEACGGPVNARIVENYDGGVIDLDAAAGLFLSPERFPELAAYRGERIIVTDGHTLLGADDKAGIAVIMTLLEYLKRHPEYPHPAIRVAFTPDEEIGRGVDHFDIAAFGADYAYTIDGGALGQIDCNTFNAAQAVVQFTGISVHPGSAKNKMKSALKMAVEFVHALPADECPETTENFEGYYHAIDIRGGVSEATVTLIIRDHDQALFEQKKRNVIAWAARFGSCAQVTVHDQYHNMNTFLQRRPEVMELARAACRACGITPTEPALRGGTDGARLSEAGLLCPNLFTGGHNFHGPYEFLPVGPFTRALDVTLALVRLAAQRPAQR